MTKTFILGMGAQKAGTSWLSNYLRARDDTDMGFAKEYHIFDAVSLPECVSYLRRTRAKVAELAGGDLAGMRGEDALLRLTFMAHPASYFAYFTDLLARPGIAVTGDITPSYSGLPREILTMIRDEFARRGVRVVPVFLMRDPVHRLNSMVRMKFRNSKLQPSMDDELAAMRRVCGSPKDAIRASYRTTLENIDAVFGARSHIAFYEEFFSEESLRALCDALGVGYDGQARFDVRANASQTGNQLSDAVIREFAVHYRDQFDYCAQRFGAERMARNWTSFA